MCMPVLFAEKNTSKKEQVKMNEKEFDNAVDEIIGNIESAQVVHMDLLRSGIKAEFRANARALNVTAIAQKIMGTPFNVECGQPDLSGCSGSIKCGDTHKILSKDPEVKRSIRGNLTDISFVQNASVLGYNKDFYHHCSQIQDDLVRLVPSTITGVYVCPICGQEFEFK